MASGLDFGAMLTSALGDALVNFPQRKADMDFQRQYRQQEIESRDLKNQQQQMQMEYMQRQMADQDLIRQAARSGMQPSDDMSLGNAMGDLGGSGGAQPQSAAPASASAAAPSGSVKGPLSMDQLAQLDQQNGLPVGTSYGIMMAESGGKVDAVSPKGAQGPFQVMPATAQDPGYGLKSFNPKDPNGAMSYFGAMYKKAGGDISKALGFWNAGPAGNPNNPETQGFIPKVQKGIQEFQQMYGLRNQAAQGTPAGVIDAAQATGVNPGMTVYDQAARAQQGQIKQALATAQNLTKAGRPDLAAQYYDRAAELQQGQVKLQKQQLDAQKEANTETAKLATGVTDQASYDNFLGQLRSNPAMGAATRGLNLTGDYAQDRNKIESLAQRTMTLKDQADIRLKQATLALKQQEEQRKQDKEDRIAMAPAKAAADTAARMEVNRKAGIPTAQTSSELYGDPKMAQAAQAKINTANAAQLRSDTAVRGTISKAGETLTRMQELIDKGAVTGSFAASLGEPGQGGSGQSTGGMLQKFAYTTMLDAKQQEFAKLSNDLVLGLQDLKSAQQGSGRSAQTAAMARIIQSTKPSLSMSKDANERIIGSLKAEVTDQLNLLAFTDEYARANPTADRNLARSEWAAYRQAVPLYRNGEPNPQAIPGKPEYIDYHDWFREHRY
jgi:soluble lytic murein transglycosylase-like protein